MRELMQLWGARLAAVVAATLLVLSGAAGWKYLGQTGTAALGQQTLVETAEHSFDEQGIPFLEIPGAGKQRHPAWIALYALAYEGREIYDPSMAGLKNENRFNSCLQWLKSNLKQKSDGLWVWDYNFDNTYNDVSIQAPWSSAFAQAVGIQAFVAAYDRDGDPDWLDLARKAAKSLFVPVDQGGFLFQSGNDIWFEEVPAPAENPSHILNGHMRVLIALKELADVTGDEEIERWYRRGCDTLYRWLPRFDTGYALRYDLNPQKKDLLFRLANPYGFPNHSLAVHKVVLRDPVSKAEVALDVGADGDHEGEQRIAGIHWGEAQLIAGRMARRLIPSELDTTPNQMRAPHSYFYLPLPGEWKNNLRDDWYELEIVYYDDQPANITAQMRAIAPGPAFRDLRDGDLHLTGAGHWRRWIVPVRPTDLGYWVGKSYAEKHAAYLKKLTQWDNRFAGWARMAEGYLSLTSPFNKQEETFVYNEKQSLPEQKPMTPIYSLDKEGVVMQHAWNSQTRWLPSGIFDPSGGKGTPVYSPFIVAQQLLLGSNLTGGAYSVIDKREIKRKPALEWLLNPANYKEKNGAIIYNYEFDNSYNDISTKSPWPSAFGQAYVLKALTYADEESIAKNIVPEIEAAAKAFSVDVKEGGIQTIDRKGKVFFEEVPNATHVLNAHLVSVNELSHSSRHLKNDKIKALAGQGIDALRYTLHLFDTGYWLRYDQNPKKEILLKIDYLVDGDQSPMIDEVYLENPQTGRYAGVDVGSGKDFEGDASVISGADWREQQILDGKDARGFLSAGNTYLKLQLPETSWSNYFDVPPHRLVIRYKDVSPGKFVVKTQSINSGESFIPLRGGVWHTTGDQDWKEIAFEIRPQDMGWFKGADYQKYEVDQLDKIANLTNDWFFYQYAERHRNYLDQADPNNVIIGANQVEARPPVELEFLSGSPTYSGYSFTNSLDSDPNSDYTAGSEGEPGFVLLKLDRPIRSGMLTFTWESGTNVPGKITIRSINEAGESQAILAESKVQPAPSTSVSLKSGAPFERIRIDFQEFFGQPRVLLRRILLREEKQKTLLSEDKQKTLIHDIDLSVVKASPTYSEHGFDKALDGDPNNNYTAGVEGFPGFVVLKLSRKARLSAALIQWESEINTAARVTVSRAAPDGTPLELLGQNDSDSGGIFKLPLRDDPEVEYLRFDFSDFRGQPRVLLREIRLLERIAGGKNESKSTENPNRPFLGAMDERNPLHIFRVPITRRIKNLSDDLAQGAASEHEMIVRFMEYISRFRVGLTKDGTPDATITERLGACGTFTGTLLALAACQGIDGRYINMMNFPSGMGHTIGELFVDGQWRVYDPTYAAFYYDVSSGDRSALSFDQLRTQFKDDPETVGIIYEAYRPGFEGFTGRDIFLKADPIGVIGPDKPMTFPLKLCLSERATLDSVEFGVKFQGANYIGAAGINQNQKWTLEGLEAGSEYIFCLKAARMGGDNIKNDKTFKLHATLNGGELLQPAEHQLDFSSDGKPVWSIKFRASSDAATIAITHPYMGPDYRYIEMESYRLGKASASK